MLILRMEMQERNEKNTITKSHQVWQKFVYLRKNGNGGISEHLISFSPVQGVYSRLGSCLWERPVICAAVHMSITTQFHFAYKQDLIKTELKPHRMLSWHCNKISDYDCKGLINLNSIEKNYKIPFPCMKHSSEYLNRCSLLQVSNQWVLFKNICVKLLTFSLVCQLLQALYFIYMLSVVSKLCEYVRATLLIDYSENLVGHVSIYTTEKAHFMTNNAILLPNTCRQGFLGLRSWSTPGEIFHLPGIYRNTPIHLML